jgi:peptidoglycan/LPS O-acetylase OafA/YrhL
MDLGSEVDGPVPPPVVHDLQCQTFVAKSITTGGAESQRNSIRVESVELVRGLAALAVCIFHFTKYLWPAESITRKVGSFGWVGVESFFVISGFIIPYAMHRAGYQYAHFFRFLVKRYLRLAPPYLVAIALAQLLWWVGSFVPG